MEILFVLGFFLMLLATMAVATLIMFVGGLFALVIKLLPWLALAAAWVCRAFCRDDCERTRRKLRRKTSRLDRRRSY